MTFAYIHIVYKKNPKLIGRRRAFFFHMKRAVLCFPNGGNPYGPFDCSIMVHAETNGVPGRERKAPCSCSDNAYHSWLLPDLFLTSREKKKKKKTPGLIVHVMIFCGNTDSVNYCTLPSFKDMTLCKKLFVNEWGAC